MVCRFRNFFFGGENLRYPKPEREKYVVLEELFRAMTWKSAIKAMSLDEISDAVVERFLLSEELAHLAQASF